jgi:hypothetical protein
MNFDPSILNRYRGKRILLDANLLLLWLIGTFQRTRIEVFKRTASFSTIEFDVLSSLLLEFRTIVTTPHVLTEVSNLANSLPENVKSAWFDHFSMRIAALEEILEPASKIAQQTSFNPFGLTDAAIQHASVDTLVLTEDFRLSGYLNAQGIVCLNLRDLALTVYQGS